MAALQKYMFDLDFDAEAPPKPETPATPVEMADGMEAEEPPPPTYTQFDLDDAKRVAFAEGHEAGVREASEVTARRQAEALAAMAAGFGKVMAEQRAAVEGLRRDAVQLAISITRKLQPEMARRHGTEEIAGVIRECLLQIDEAARLTVRVHPDLLEGVRAEAQRVADEAEFEGKILFTPDAKLTLGDCRVEWGNGGADRDQAQLWSEIESIVARALDGMRTAAASAPVAS